MVEEVTNDMLQTLFEQQLRCWELARTNYEALAHVKEREISFGKFKVRLQYNPARMASTAAAMDKVAQRACFLCEDNRPSQQFEIPDVFGKYTVLVNPYPIFPRHFTIPAVKHTPQRIAGNYPDMLKLARSLNEYVLFYNGAKCGASAPDHMHFQAGSKGFLPIENYWDWGMDGYRFPVTGEDGMSAFMTDGMRTMQISRSAYPRNMVEMLDKYMSAMEPTPQEPESPVNLFTWFDPEDGNYYSVIFTRRKHRPDSYYAEGNKKIMVSPGCVDMAGVLIVPREEDFNKITKKDVTRIFREVSLGMTEH